MAPTQAVDSLNSKQQLEPSTQQNTFLLLFLVPPRQVENEALCARKWNTNLPKERASCRSAPQRWSAIYGIWAFWAAFTVTRIAVFVNLTRNKSYSSSASRGACLRKLCKWGAAGGVVDVKVDGVDEPLPCAHPTETAR